MRIFFKKMPKYTVISGRITLRATKLTSTHAALNGNQHPTRARKICALGTSAEATTPMLLEASDGTAAG